jgi:hypothetical protein
VANLETILDDTYKELNQLRDMHLQEKLGQDRLKEQITYMSKETDSSRYKLDEIKDLFCSIVHPPATCDWQECLGQLLLSSKCETINIKSVNFLGNGLAGDNRLLFMPHSPGVYMALVLKDADDIERDQMPEESKDLKESRLQSQLSQISLSEETQN